MKLKVLRKVERLSPKIVEVVNRQDGIYEIGGAAYVDTDYPRDAIVAEEILERTVGYALADSEGTEILKEFDSLKATEKAAASARVTFDVQVDLDEVAPDVGRALPIG